MVDPITTTIAGVTAAANIVSAMAATKPLFEDSKVLKEVYSQKNVDGLLEQLHAVMKDFETEVDRQKTKVPSETYKCWSKRVIETEHYIADLKKKYKKREKNIPADITSDIKDQMIEVKNLIEEGKGINDKLLVRAPPESVEKMKAPEFRNSDSLQNILDGILTLLENQHIKGVMVYGPMGVGKTAILKNLNNHANIAKEFDIVIWMKVSTEGNCENLSREHLQKSILKRLKVRLKSNTSCDDVASRISKELEGKKYLLLMDDVKQNLNLSDIGIPITGKGCKIVLTTRQANVCHELVSTAVKVLYLSNDEAWDMFKDVLQHPSLVDNPKICPIAYEICKQCGGLPLLIEKVASIFKEKYDERLWCDGLNNLRIWAQKECQGVKEMINFFKKCYNDLDDIHKQCFLYGTLYPEDSDIYTEDLLERWRAEKFTIHGSSILIDLKNVALLEKSKGDKYVSIHKFIRQVFLNILSSDDKCLYLVKTDEALLKTIDKSSWLEKKYISLSNNVKLHKLPDDPDGSTLSTLFLQKNSGLKEVPNSFFVNMNKLFVLDLCESEITSLPESLLKLKSLKVLCLSDCIRLNALPSNLENLSSLEVIDISRSGINGIPEHLQNMERLRFLRISLPKHEGETDITNACKIISSMSNLEELVVDMEPNDQLSNTAVIMSIISNVVTLEKFTALRFSIRDDVIDIIEVGVKTFRVQVPDPKILQALPEKDCFYERVKHLQYFQIIVDCDKTEKFGIPDYVKYPMYIKYVNGEGNDLLFPEQIDKSDIAFELLAHKNIEELSNFKVANSTDKITSFFVGNCEEIKTIIGKVDCKELSNVKHLYLDNLPKLESIWKEPLQQLCLTKLQTLFLSGCRKLTNIFPQGTVQQLVDLQSLRIEGCLEIVEMFLESDTTGKHCVLPKLKKLIIINMPKLKFISKNSLTWPSLVELQVFKCPLLENVSIAGCFAPNLKIEELDI